MNSGAIAQFVIEWLFVNVGALLLLAVLSYFGSRWSLEALEFLERWLYRVEYKSGAAFDPNGRRAPDADEEPKP